MEYYGTYTDYQSIYGIERLQETDFTIYALDVNRIMDRYTTGVDGFRKLKEAYPDDMETDEIIRACFCKLIDVLYTIKTAEDDAQSARGYEVTADGLRGKLISSRSAGNESISYGVATGSNAITTALDKAVTDRQEKEKMCADIVSTYLSGLQDANGVNLLYLGPYPRGGVRCTRIP